MFSDVLSDSPRGLQRERAPWSLLCQLLMVSRMMRARGEHALSLSLVEGLLEQCSSQVPFSLRERTTDALATIALRHPFRECYRGFSLYTSDQGVTALINGSTCEYVCVERVERVAQGRYLLLIGSPESARHFIDVLVEARDAAGG
jgi:hypothetical protein